MNNAGYLHLVYGRLVSIPQHSLTGRVLRWPLRLIPRSAVVRIRSGINLGQRWVFGSSKPGFWLGTYEADKQGFTARVTKPGTIVWDVGANVGFYSIAFSRLVGPAGRVLAFEPLAANFVSLLRHLDLNGCRNVTPVQAAVADTSRLADFECGPDALMGQISPRGGRFVVPTVSVDDLLRTRPDAAPSLMKLDVEGAEGAVLEGARNLLGTRGPDILLALHGPEAERQCRSILAETGYRCFYLDGNPVGDGALRSDEIFCTKGGFPQVSG